jgi:hypothetical protein
VRSALGGMPLGVAAAMTASRGRDAEVIVAVGRKGDSLITRLAFHRCGPEDLQMLLRNVALVMLGLRSSRTHAGTMGSRRPASRRSKANVQSAWGAAMFVAFLLVGSKLR